MSLEDLRLSQNHVELNNETSNSHPLFIVPLATRNYDYEHAFYEKLHTMDLVK